MACAAKGILVAMVSTFFEAVSVPVFWPVRVMYFIMPFCIATKRQIKHMIKYRYMPFTQSKGTYKGKGDSGKTLASQTGRLATPWSHARRFEPW